MNKRYGGFIFLMTLCVIFVISILLLTCMQQILLYSKAINGQERQHQNFYQLEGMVTQLAQEHHLLIDSHCVERKDAANAVIDRLIHNEGCSLTVEQVHYRYFLEDLGTFPCLVLEHKGVQYATRHLRITVLQLSDAPYSAAVLQVRYLKPDESQRCQGEVRPVSEGISSWRYFPDFLSMSE